MSAMDPALDRLTEEQVLAAGTPEPMVYIEAYPGSGKTTVASQRYGALRYSRHPHAPGQGVIALSFTRAATAELRGRVESSWGPTAILGAHRIVTLDSLIADLFLDLLRAGLIAWPNGHTELEILDTWTMRLAHRSMLFQSELVLIDAVVTPIRTFASRRLNPMQADYVAEVGKGVCTHDDLRRLLTLAAKLPGVVDRLRARLTSTVSAMVVDEIFDANRLDLAVVRLAANAGIPVTVVGDPWQALYGFRGAEPELVPDVIDKIGMRRLPLTRSFRWQTDEQAQLAADLRASLPVQLPTGCAADVEVVLAHQWEHLWDVGAEVLPTSFKPQAGSPEQAAATLLLNRLTSSRLGQPATYLADALLTLQMSGPDALERLEPALDRILARIVDGDEATAKKIWPEFVEVLATEAQRDIKTNSHPNYWRRLVQIADRARQTRLVPGMTVHQAKGREWSTVGMRMTEEDVALLGAGLTAETEIGRQLYVALTRARRRAVAI